MNPIELRLGNWVKVGSNISTVEYITGVKIGLTGNAITNKCEDVEPIELSPDILTKAGFTARPHLNDHFIRLDETTQSIIIIDDEFNLKVCNQNSHAVRFPAKCKYLHSLQNAYYSLIGTELPIKL